MSITLAANGAATYVGRIIQSKSLWMMEDGSIVSKTSEIIQNSTGVATDVFKAACEKAVPMNDALNGAVAEKLTGAASGGIMAAARKAAATVTRGATGIASNVTGTHVAIGAGVVVAAAATYGAVRHYKKKKNADGAATA